MIGTLCSGAIHLPQLAVTRVPEFLQFSPAALLALPAWFSWNPLLSYFAAVVLLLIGVGIAIKKAPPQADWLDKIVLCGPVFIAMPMVVFGLDHYFFPAEIGQIIPAWIPAHAFWVYFVGTCLILGGLSIVFQKHAWLAAGLFGVMLLCFEALMNIPGVVALPHSRIIWSLCVREFSFSWGALSLAAMHTQQWRMKGTHWLISVARNVLGIALVFFGVEHFLHPELLPGVPLEQLTPNFIPAHSLWGYLTGVVYVLAGICLLINKKARTAATWAGLFVLFAVIFFCVPYMLQYASDIGKGLNVPADTLVLSGALLCLAASLHEKSPSSSMSMNR
ncbi:MAG TPA: hypothetical protein VN025_04855 [Candidatus Dormibacteraeota bacterium]|jgi:uncharacterized membrane protein|nr:hypothetical protein [Candidatus Dormibacteraeota bacterium]